MFKFILFAALFVSASAFAQDMSQTEEFEQAYVENEDGSSKYVGKCSLHEDYENKQFSTTKSILKYTVPSDLTSVQIEKLIAKFDKALITTFLKDTGMDDFGVTLQEIFHDYFDDLTVDEVSSKLVKGSLIRFNYGVGGGNGGFIFYQKVQTGSSVSYVKLANTFDGDLAFCDKKVWLQK